MDPLSVAASVVGLLAAAGKISTVLTTLVRNTKDAPKLAHTVLQEVSDISATLAQLQAFLIGTRAGPKSRMGIIMVEQVVVTLTTCVMTFSELEEIVANLDKDGPVQLWINMAWARKEAILTKLLDRLQSSKMSMNLMLTTLTCASVDEARSSVENLTNLVHRLLQNNQDLALRLGSLEDLSVKMDKYLNASRTTETPADDDTYTITPQRTTEESTAAIEDTLVVTFTFDEALNTSRVYSRARRRRSAETLQSSAAFSFGWSCLSETSLSNVSNLSVISIPIALHELSNKTHYMPRTDINQADAFRLSTSNPFPEFSRPPNPIPSDPRYLKGRPTDVHTELVPTALVLKNIPFAVRKEYLVEIMTHMDLPLPNAFNYHFDNGVFRGLAFASYASADETAQVIASLNDYELQGRRLRVEYKKRLPLQPSEMERPLQLPQPSLSTDLSEYVYYAIPHSEKKAYPSKYTMALRRKRAYENVRDGPPGYMEFPKSSLDEDADAQTGFYGLSAQC